MQSPSSNAGRNGQRQQVSAQSERLGLLAIMHGKRQADSAMHERAKDGCFLFSLARSVETEMKSRGNFHLCV
jgi:hypothetical protein